MNTIFLQPKTMEIYPHTCQLPFPLAISAGDNPGISMAALDSVCPDTFCLSKERQDICFAPMPQAPYDWNITVSAQKITVEYTSPRNAFYALVAVYLLKLQLGSLPCFTAREKADVENRGYMLDISRGKVPRLSTLKWMADILARFQYNQFYLYIEGFSFYYPSFSAYCREESSLSIGEIRELSAYCRERFIELIPIQNTLGHMAKWLSQKEFSTIAECPGGFAFKGYQLPPTTLDAADPETFRLIEKMTGDLWQAFSADKVHFGLDEPFEFCRGKNKDKNPRELLLRYIQRLNAFAARNGRKMSMWTDALFQYDCLGEELSKDITYFEWGYEKEYPFERRCQRLSQAGVDFFVCPGTSSWLSFTGITDNMLINIANAVKTAVKYKASGILLTDWGDENHMQPLWCSMPAIAYCSALCRNIEWVYSDGEIARALDAIVFQDQSGHMGKLLLEAGRYSNFEEIRLPCRTLAHLIYSNKITSLEGYRQSVGLVKLLVGTLSQREVVQAYPMEAADGSRESIRQVLAHVDGLLAQLSDCRMKADRAQSILAETECALMFVKLFTMVRERIEKNVPFRDFAGEALALCRKYKEARNVFSKSGGFQETLSPLKEMFGITEV